MPNEEKPDTKEYVQCNSINMKFKNRQSMKMVNFAVE